MIDYSIFQNKKAAYYTLGCKLNFAETSTFAEMLSQLGVRTAEKGENADICLINTCSVTEVADHKCRQQIHKMVRNHPGAFVVVTGCYAQLEPERIANIDGVNLVLGSNEKADLIQYLNDAWLNLHSISTSSSPATVPDASPSGPASSIATVPDASPSGQASSPATVPDASASVKGTSHATWHSVKTKEIKTFAPSCSRGNRTRYFLKVQDGCNYFCTYCTIPYARGNSRNPSISSLVEQAESVAARGGKEIVLTGVNIGDFGQTTGESFFDLVKALDHVEGIQRYRISSIEPNLLTDEIIDYCAQSRAFMPHFHIPLQSGSDEVLRLMHRRYDTSLFRHKIEKVKEVMPNAFIGVDIMVGCRGETPECFEECFSFLDSLDVQQLHVFPYSERPGTAALNIPYIVDDKEKKLRSNRLLELSDRKTKAFYQKFIGSELDVLMEKSSKGRVMHGFTENYIRVELPASLAREEFDNEILQLRLGDFNHDGSCLKAELV